MALACRILNTDGRDFFFLGSAYDSWMAATTLLFIVILLAAAGVDGMIRHATQSIDDGWQLVKMSSGLAYTGGNNRWASFTVTVPNGR